MLSCRRQYENTGSSTVNISFSRFPSRHRASKFRRSSHGGSNDQSRPSGIAASAAEYNCRTPMTSCTSNSIVRPLYRQISSHERNRPFNCVPSTPNPKKSILSSREEGVAWVWSGKQASGCQGEGGKVVLVKGNREAGLVIHLHHRELRTLTCGTPIIFTPEVTCSRWVHRSTAHEHVGDGLVRSSAIFGAYIPVRRLNPP
ncbi:hypothetical protein FA13DRAFT_398622 [Coprinellus micaceus]|uniref:Uncharacterized protein n=1 Tax=Coprinellus micaceus TaxID=71717 RepID=A0A4Y7TX69_COPMI|nr:hypothetical protein FA13DRAFT_398622 [Coprinellus micaceus]